MGFKNTYHKHNLTKLYLIIFSLVDLQGFFMVPHISIAKYLIKNKFSIAIYLAITQDFSMDSYKLLS